VLQAAKDLPKAPPSLDEICSALDCGTAQECETVTKALKVTLKGDMASISVSVQQAQCDSGLVLSVKCDADPLAGNADTSHLACASHT
jgi:hypothetical protein